LQQSGFKTTDKRVLRLVSLAAQKFLSEVTTDSLRFCLKRTPKQSGRETRYVLTTEDLAQSLSDYGINLHKPEYYSDNLVNEQITTRSVGSSSASAPPPSSFNGPTNPSGSE